MDGARNISDIHQLESAAHTRYGVDLDDAQSVLLFRSAGDEQRDQAVRKDEMPKVISAELRFEPVVGGPLRAGHHAGISDQHLQRLSLREQTVGARAHARQRCEVQFDQLDACVRRRSGPYRFRGALAFVKVSHGNDDVRTVCGQSPRRLSAEPG